MSGVRKDGFYSVAGDTIIRVLDTLKRFNNSTATTVELAKATKLNNSTIWLAMAVASNMGGITVIKNDRTLHFGFNSYFDYRKTINKLYDEIGIVKFLIKRGVQFTVRPFPETSPEIVKLTDHEIYFEDSDRNQARWTILNRDDQFVVWNKAVPIRDKKPVVEPPYPSPSEELPTSKQDKETLLRQVFFTLRIHKATWEEAQAVMKALW